MKYLLFLLAFLVAGCSSTGPQFTEQTNYDSNKSLFYVYRPNGWGLGALDAEFFLDSKRLTKLSNNGYSVHLLQPGKYNLKQRWVGGFLVDSAVKAKELEIEVLVPEKGPVFVELSTEWGYTERGSKTEWMLKQLSPEDALGRIKNTRLHQ